MNPDIKKYLDDILFSISVIESYVVNISSLREYEIDQKTIDSVERRLAIIGEALFKADRIDKTLDISGKKKVIGLRHILVHDYDLIDDATIWLIITENLPVLKLEISKLMDIN